MQLDPDLDSVVHLMAGYGHRWAICGGWALDLFRDRITRPHRDVDVAILRGDQLAVQAYLRDHGWALEIAHQGRLTPWRDGEFLDPPLHAIWCRHPDRQPDLVEILFSSHRDDLYLFRHDESITRPLDRAFQVAPCGIPILAPEIVLLIKARYPEREDADHDFEAAAPHLSVERRAWLCDALAHHLPGHRWLAALQQATGETE